MLSEKQYYKLYKKYKTKYKISSGGNRGNKSVDSDEGLDVEGSQRRLPTPDEAREQHQKQQKSREHE